MRNAEGGVPYNWLREFSMRNVEDAVPYRYSILGGRIISALHSIQIPQCADFFVHNHKVCAYVLIL